MADPLRIACLGAARITPNALLVPARTNPEVDVVAIAARDRTRAAAFAAKHHIPRVLSSYDAVIDDPDVDAVYIPLPNSLHAPWTVRAIEAGKHVLCEKPFASNAPEAEVVADVARAHPRLVVMEAFHWRYHPVAQRILDVVRSGEIGELQRVEAWMRFPLLRGADIRWRLDLAGGALMDAGCYAVSMVRTVAGTEPTVVTASARQRAAGVDASMDAELVFPGGVTGYVTTSMRSAPRVGLRVTGSRGTVRVLNPVAPQLFHLITVRPDGGQRRRERLRRSGTSYGHQLAAFVAAIREGRPFPTNVDDAVANLRVIDDIYRAAGLAPRPGALA